MERLHIDRREMKLDARDAMRTHRPSVFWIAFVFLAITWILNALETRLQFPGMTREELYAIAYGDIVLENVIHRIMENQTFLTRVLDFAIRIMSIMLSGGVTITFLSVARRANANVGTLFDMFNYFIRYLWLTILTAIFVFLWTLLLIVPGIIAAYRYSMAVYIFIDDPDKGALQCIRESKELTRGYKWQLFVLDLSFLGWILLSLIPFVSIFTLPYMETTRANFYRVLRGEFYAQPQQTPYDSDPWNR